MLDYINTAKDRIMIGDQAELKKIQFHIWTVTMHNIIITLYMIACYYTCYTNVLCTSDMLIHLVLMCSEGGKITANEISQFF